MYAVGAFAFPPSPTTPGASVASMIAPQQPALGSLPVQQVAGALAYPQVYNDARNGNAYVAQTAENSAAPSAASGFSVTSASALPSARITSFPTLFLAQLMGQGQDEQVRTLVVTYETMLAYSEVKYAPSFATQPHEPVGLMGEFFKAIKESGANANRAPSVAANQNTADEAEMPEVQPAPRAVFSAPASFASLPQMPVFTQAARPEVTPVTRKAILRAYDATRAESESFATPPKADALA